MLILLISKCKVIIKFEGVVCYLIRGRLWLRLMVMMMMIKVLMQVVLKVKVTVVFRKSNSFKYWGRKK